MGHNDVFILGAGFSKAISRRMPTMAELTSAIKARFADAGDLQLPALLQLGLDDNIELWMTYLSQDQPWLGKSSNQYNKALATRINDFIAEIIIDETTHVVKEPLPSWFRSLVQAWHEKSATVITLNYDTLVERAAISNSALSLSHIYPENFANIRSIGNTLWGADALDTFRYYKLHGSVNWHYSGREEFYGETIYYSDVTGWGGVDSDHERQSRGPVADKEMLIIPPVSEKTSYFNNEYVRGLWINAGRALSSATRVFVVGYSLPETDMGMGFFLSQYIPGHQTPWYIVNTDYEVVGRYRALLTTQDICDVYVDGSEPVLRLAHEYPTEVSGAS